jgi:hypothetical protein
MVAAVVDSMPSSLFFQDWCIDQKLQHVAQAKQGKKPPSYSLSTSSFQSSSLAPKHLAQANALLIAIFQDVPFPKAITQSKIPAPPKKAVCAVTGLPAKYFDPVATHTRTPFLSSPICDF